jgi:short-subunit dehydrogenase
MAHKKRMKKNFIVITGASKGIGKAIAEIFARNGYGLIINARDRIALKKLKEQFEKNHPIECHIFAGNLALKTEVLAFANFIIEKDIKIDALINNVGAYMADALANAEDGMLEKMLDINLLAPFYLTQYLQQKIKENKAHLFFMGSVAGVQAHMGALTYTIAKHAVTGMCKMLRKELAPTGVRVTHVVPGAVQTDSWGDFRPTKDKIMQPEAIAEAIFACFMLAENAVVEELLIRPIDQELG